MNTLTDIIVNLKVKEAKLYEKMYEIMTKEKDPNSYKKYRNVVLNRELDNSSGSPKNMKKFNKQIEEEYKDLLDEDKYNLEREIRNNVVKIYNKICQYCNEEFRRFEEEKVILYEETYRKRFNIQYFMSLHNKTDLDEADTYFTTEYEILYNAHIKTIKAAQELL